MAELAVLGATLGTAAAAAGTGAAAAAGAAAPTAAAGLGWGTALTAATTAAGLAGTGLSAAGAIRQGEHSRMIGEFNAKEMERAAAEERAAATRKAEERRLQERRVLSEQRAKAASGGAGTVGGEGYLDLISDTAERGQYYSDLEISGGEARALGWEGRADTTRWQSRAQEGAGVIKAASYGLDAGAGLLKDVNLDVDLYGARPRRGRYYS